MKVLKIQRLLLYLFFFSLNFEMLDLSGSDFFSIGKLAGILYFLSLIPSIPLFLNSKSVKLEMGLLWLFFFLMTVNNLININHVSGGFFDFTMFQNIVLLFLIVNHERRDPGILEKAFLFFAIGSVVLLIFTLLGVAVEIDSDGRLSIFGENENAVGIRMVISSVILVLTTLQNRIKLGKWRFLFLVPIPFMIGLMASTGSRVSVISLFLCFVVGVVIVRGGGPFRKFAIFLSAVLIGVYLFNYLLDSEVIYNRLMQASEQGDLAGRDIIWGKVVQLIEANPIIGVGQTGYADFMNREHGTITSPHNVILEVLAYTGIIGLFIFLFFIGKLIYVAYLYYKRTGQLLQFLLFIPIMGLILSGQLLATKLAYVIFALALSRKFYIKKKHENSLFH
ncbi:MAG: O-antigen ligase family protein [Flavobacterium sp.]|nr:MAG: O-antigen ligase family protein [Flavobacterium sp.]